MGIMMMDLVKIVNHALINVPLAVYMQILALHVKEIDYYLNVHALNIIMMICNL
jgi:hypothetical protein